MGTIGRTALVVIGLGMGLLPGEAVACLFAAPGRAPTIEGIRVAARRQTFLVGGQEVPGWDARLILAYDVVPEGQAIGVVFPVDEGVGVELEVPAGPEMVSALDWVDELTEPVIHETRDTSCQGCAVLDPVLTPPPIAGDVEWRVDWNTGNHLLEFASNVAELERWLQTNAFVLSAETDTALRQALVEGRQIVLLRLNPAVGPGALHPIRLRAAGPLRLPLSLAAGCGSRNLEITVFAGGPEPSTMDGWDVVYLDEIERDLFRDLPGLTGVYDRLTSDHDGELFIVEAVMDLEGDELLDLSWDSVTEDLLGTTGLLTRMRALVNASDLEHDASLVSDPDGHELSNQLDLRPDPEAHGASLSGEWLYLATALVLHLAHRQRRRR